MTKEEKQRLVEAWELKGGILADLQRLARMNVTLAYGCIRTAEVLIDLLLVDLARKTKAAPPDEPASPETPKTL